MPEIQISCYDTISSASDRDGYKLSHRPSDSIWIYTDAHSSYWLIRLHPGIHITFLGSGKHGANWWTGCASVERSHVASR